MYDQFHIHAILEQMMDPLSVCVCVCVCVYIYIYIYIYIYELINTCVRVRSLVSFWSIFKLNMGWSVPLPVSEMDNVFPTPFAEFCDSRVRFHLRVR